ncbi:MAG: VOC family protein [Acidobacteriaceae bacterium]|nr:VOC family protein [Acidobacteriaceae bacterium]
MSDVTTPAATTPALAPTEALRLHHTGVAVKDIAQAAANYVTRFGYSLASPVFHDPAQTARVQFLKLPGQAAFLELVTPDGEQGKLVAATKAGGALHHLCFIANGPLEAEVERLRSTGMLLISEPTPAVAFAGRRICWLMGNDRVPVELIEPRFAADPCLPGLR